MTKSKELEIKTDKYVENILKKGKSRTYESEFYDQISAEEGKDLPSTFINDVGIIRFEIEESKPKSEWVGAKTLLITSFTLSIALLHLEKRNVDKLIELCWDELLEEYYD